MWKLHDEIMLKMQPSSMRILQKGWIFTISSLSTKMSNNNNIAVRWMLDAGHTEDTKLKGDEKNGEWMDLLFI